MAGDIRLAGGAGEYMESATVVEWRIKVGDRVRLGEVVVVVETAKAATEIEAAAEGVLAEINAPVGTEVEIGSLLGRIETGSGRVSEPVAVAPVRPHEPPLTLQAPNANRSDEDRVAISPWARRLAREVGLDPGSVRGSGPNGRIKARDIERALLTRVPSPTSQAVASGRDLVVFVHGFGANAGTWAAVQAALGSGFQTRALDLPGHGRREPLEQPSFRALVDAVSADLSGMSGSRIHLVGHSLGAAIAATIATTPVVDLGSLTLLAPAGFGPGIDGRFIEGFLAARSAESLSPWLERLVADTAVLPTDFAALVMRERSRPRLLDAQTELARRLFPDGTQLVRVPDELGKLSAPTRIVWGRADRIIPFSDARELAGTLALHLLSDVGHMPHVESPAIVARIIAENIRSAARTV